MVEFVEREVSLGEYGSSSEVVREALRLLRHEKAILEQDRERDCRRDPGRDTQAVRHLTEPAEHDIRNILRDTMQMFGPRAG